MTARSSILVTGGAGFVGSHFVRAASDAGSRVVVLDDLSGGAMPTLPTNVAFIQGDVGDRTLVGTLLRDHAITAVAHFAGKIQVAESVAKPELYFETNLVKTLALFDVIRETGPKYFLFSSTAAVYGTPSEQPITEAARLAPLNPYGMSKLGVEHALMSYGVAYGLRWAALRYFNAAGAHADGSLREGHEPETHLIPLAIDAALGKCPPLTVFGDDYATPDGTCIRDYVHVSDLAEAHLAAIDALDAGAHVGATNLGTGTGFSVKQVIDTCGRVLGTPVPHVFAGRRAGDAPELVANAGRAREILGWRPTRASLGTIIEDAARSRR